MGKSTPDTFAPDCKANIYFAPSNTPFPASTAVALPAAWLNVGFLEDAPDFSRDVKVNEEQPWNSCSPVRTLMDEENIEVSLKFQQISTIVEELYWGPGTWTNPTAATTVFTPAGGLAERALAIELTDGTKVVRWLFAKVGVSKIGKLKSDKAKLASREVTLKRLAGATQPDFQIQYSWAVPVA